MSVSSNVNVSVSASGVSSVEPNTYLSGVYECVSEASVYALSL